MNLMMSLQPTVPCGSHSAYELRNIMIEYCKKKKKKIEEWILKTNLKACPCKYCFVVVVPLHFPRCCPCCIKTILRWFWRLLLIPNIFNDTFDLLLMISLACLWFGYKMFFFIIGPGAKLNYFGPNIWI